MRAAVELEDAIVEVLDAEAEARHAQLADRASLASVSVPGSHSNVISSADVHGVTAVSRLTRLSQLLRRQERRRAAAEVDEVERPAGDRRLLRVQLPLARQDVEILADLGRVLVGVDAEIAEVAALPAERDVQVEAERDRPGAGGAASAGRASRSTASSVHTENGG